MAVQAASLEILEKAAVPPAQARAIVQVIEIEIAGSKETLATKQDVLLLKQDVLIVRHEMAELRADLRAELKTVAADLRGELADLRGELRSEIHSSASSVARQMYGAMLGQLAVLLGVAYFFVSHVPR